MIYLIKNVKGEIKIGHVRYASRLNARIKSYNTILPLVELLDSCEGTVELERRLHNILFFKGLNLYGEWFKDDPIIYKIWEMAKNKKWKPKYLKYVDTTFNYEPNIRGLNTTYDMYLYDHRDVDSQCRPLWDGNYSLQWLRTGYTLQGKEKRLAKQR